jgi:succinyl-CoA synthetase alpha subunit
MKTAAARAVEIANTVSGKAAKAAAKSASTTASTPVVFSRNGQYEQTIDNLKVKQGDSVLVVGLGKAAQSNSTVAFEYGTNIVGASAPKKGGQEFLGKPVYGGVQEAVNALRPRIASVFAPPVAAADSIIECIEAEIPLVVSYAEGVPQKDQLRVQAALRSQNKTRVIGANCPGAIFPHQRIKLGIQPLRVHSPGMVGLISRSGTISYDLAQQTTTLGLGQSAVFGLGGDPFPGTRSWEALKVLLEDPLTKIVCVVGEVGGQMEEEAAAYYAAYRKATANPKPVVGFVAGAATQRGKVYGHAGAVWWEPNETTASKRQAMADAGFVMAPTIGDIGGLIKSEVDRLGLAPAAQAVDEAPRVAYG